MAVAAKAAARGPVALLDLDPQGSLAHWWNDRSEEEPYYLQTTLQRLPEDRARLARAGLNLLFIDTPPVLAVPDARVIAQQADAVLYVVKWNSTDRSAVESGLDLFSQANVRVTGLALTRANPRKISRYGYSGYGYGYGSGAAKKYYAR